MTVTYRTIILHVAPTPMGLLGERWVVDHWCNACRRRVTSDQLIAHARGHERFDDHVPGRSFPTASDTGTMTPDVIEPDSTEEVCRG